MGDVQGTKFELWLNYFSFFFFLCESIRIDMGPSAERKSVAANEAAVVVQRYTRGHLLRAKGPKRSSAEEEERRDRAAVRIQCCFRRYAAAMRFVGLWLDSQRQREDRRHFEAARCIQCRFRCFRAKRKVRRLQRLLRQSRKGSLDGSKS